MYKFFAGPRALIQSGRRSEEPGQTSPVTGKRLLVGLVACLVLWTETPPAPAQATNEPPKSSDTAAAPAPDAAAAATASVAEERAPKIRQPTPETERGGTGELRLNFRGAPLELVLNYLSEAVGLVIVLDAEVKGKVDLWSEQPVDEDQALEALDNVLNQNGYSAIRRGRLLTIVSRDEAKKRDLPVRSGSDPAGIPENERMVTQILPVHYANATQLTKDLQPLLPTYANLTANESGNALVLTAAQSDIHRMAEIVKALDTSISSVSVVHVYPLNYADAKDLVNAIKELFAPAPTQQANLMGGRGAQIINRFLGGPGGPNAASSAGGGANTRVVAVADERTNSLIVSAPEDAATTISHLVKEIDTPATDVTELRVFHLEHADPVEMASLFTQVFPDDTKTASQNQNMGFRFNRGGNRSMAAANTPSERLKKQNRVLAVADQRTSSLVVSASSEVMPQIAEMIAQLDSDRAKEQKVYVYDVQNAEVQDVVSVLQDMFQRTSMQMNRNSSLNNNPLDTRSRQNLQTGGSTGFGNSRNSMGLGGSTRGGLR